MTNIQQDTCTFKSNICTKLLSTLVGLVVFFFGGGEGSGLEEEYGGVKTEMR